MNSLITLILLFYKDGFVIKYPTKFDIPLNKKPKPNHPDVIISSGTLYNEKGYY